MLKSCLRFWSNYDEIFASFFGKYCEVFFGNSVCLVDWCLITVEVIDIRESIVKPDKNRIFLKK